MYSSFGLSKCISACVSLQVHQSLSIHVTIRINLDELNERMRGAHFHANMTLPTHTHTMNNINVIEMWDKEKQLECHERQIHTLTVVPHHLWESTDEP